MRYSLCGDLIFGMSVMEDTLYYSIRSGVYGETEDEREVLLQEQRYCRARARKLSLETNRRRKALDEKRKQWDVQEQRLRENILQQRHQQVQEATENFQRAHLPPSQRKRPAAFKRRTPNLDEALHHIQGSPLLYTHPSQFWSGASPVSRSCTPSPKPSGGARHLRALSAAEAYTKLLQEKSLSNFQNHQTFFLNDQKESQTLLREKEQDPQEYLDTPCSETESLSSLDSLENGDPQKSHDTLPVCSSQQSTTCAQSFYNPLDNPKLQESNCLPSPLRPSHPASSIAKSFLEEILNKESDLAVNSHSLRYYESAEKSRNLQNLTQHRFDNLKDQSQAFDAHGCQKELTQQDLVANSEHMTHDNDRNAQGNILKDKGTAVAHCKTQALPDTTPLEFSSLTKDLKSESQQQTRALEEKYAKHSSVMQTSLPTGRCKHSNSPIEAFSSSNARLSITYQTDLSSPNLQQTEAVSSLQLQKHKPYVDEAPRLKAESKPLCIEEAIGIDPKNETDVTKLAKAGMLKSSTGTEEPNRTPADPVTHCAPNNVRFLKGILKNHLKSKSANVKFTYTPSHLLFTKEVAILIRDSVELARAKLNEPEKKRNIKKKLRWFDEVHRVEGEERVFGDPNRHANLPQQTHKQLSADHSDHVNLLTGVSKNISSKTSAVPAGPQSTRHAWADVGPQESRAQEHIKEPTSQKRSLCIGGPRTPRRVRSARVSSCPVTSRARKGTIIRPQSAREAQHVAKTQGKSLVPRPPPKPEVAEVDLAECPVYISKADEGVQTMYKDAPDLQNVVSPPVLRTDGICAPAPLCYTYSHEAGVCSLSPPDALADSGRRRCGENGICLDRTPTDEEIALLWHGVRSALASKDGDPQSFLAHNGPLSPSPQVCASLSHVTINGDSLINGVKGSSRMGGFFLSSSNVRSPIRRQAMESNMVKNRVPVENSRIQTTGATQRKPSISYQVTVPTHHLNKNGHAVDSEGPEVSDGAHEVVDCPQAHKSYIGSTVPQNQRTHSLNIGALSLEEQKILQSLERLNQRLQYVQDTAAGNPTVRGIFALGPAFKQQCETVSVCTRRRGASAESHIRTQQRF
ncbi:centrosomal protein of 126 kDa isoform X1 [Danio rerio]|uniref:Centrosomal protein of 126 kDa isoform X1 n=6 Tax=Danio rerio TaxID=7955 RepID=A0AC58HVU7_DANRE|nr:centrosomal protein of 126 kDa isoform X1 [Danio rerio]|eukprot:XP_009292067.1 centrosomal protein of 126 kDa isoform X1 [Danio rerio]